MKAYTRFPGLGLSVLLMLAVAVRADDKTPADGPDTRVNEDAAKKYTLRYKFQPGERVRWNVVHRSRVRTTVGESTKVAETVSESVKAWRVTSAKPNGTAVFAHMVESVDMRQKLTGCKQVRYNSQTDKKPPHGFETVAKSVGVPLSIVTIDTRGKILDRQRRPEYKAAEQDGQMTIPFPEEAVPVDHTWSLPYEMSVQLPSGGIKKIKTQQTYTLTGVKTGIATITVATQILTPIHDPAIEAQLIQRESSGTVRFDIEAGRIIRQQMDVDKRVVGFRGEASSLHYLTRFTEELVPPTTKTAQRDSAARN